MVDIADKFMYRCIELASQGVGLVSPNPMVGAVLVHENKIIGEGYHVKYGEAHAEVQACNNVPFEWQDLIPFSTLYVNLEPCSHYGKTPPCVDFIIRAKIPEVIIGCKDPNPEVGGRGYEKLIHAGVKVRMGVLEKYCRTINKYFITYHEKRRPYVTLKWAQSKDGFIAGENNKRVHFTNEYSDALVHKMRSEHMAILVGGRTVLADNPKLTVRKWKGKNPVRLSIDKLNTFQNNFHICNTDAQTIIFNFTKEEKQGNVRWKKILPAEKIIPQVSELLFDEKIHTILVEGGALTLQEFIAMGVWDEAKIFISDHIISKGTKAPQIPGTVSSTEKIFNNLLITSKPV